MKNNKLLVSTAGVAHELSKLIILILQKKSPKISRNVFGGESRALGMHKTGNQGGSGKDSIPLEPKRRHGFCLTWDESL